MACELCGSDFPCMRYSQFILRPLSSCHHKKHELPNFISSNPPLHTPFHTRFSTAPLAYHARQESLLVLAKFGQPSSREDADAVDTLRYTWQRVQSHAAEVQSLLRSVEPHFRGQLVRNLAQFERDVRQFCTDYRRQGPMSPGLEPREASDRMQLFQVRYGGMGRMFHHGG